MFKFLVLMVIPVMIFLYTLSFTRWLVKSSQTAIAPVSAAMLGVISLGVSTVAIWRLVM